MAEPTGPDMEDTSPHAAITSFLTDTTCGEGCWNAKEDICRCCCGGKNHGVLRTADGERPPRMAKIGGPRYYLKAIGSTLEDLAQEINYLDGKTYYYEYTQKYAAARLKPPSESQREWEELQPFAPDPTLPRYINQSVDLLWVREDKAALYDQAVKNMADHSDRHSTYDGKFPVGSEEHTNRVKENERAHTKYVADRAERIERARRSDDE